MTRTEKNVIINGIAAECILDYVKKNPKSTRKAVLDGTAVIFKQKCSEKKINDITKNEARSYVGKSLNDLLSEKALLSENGFITESADDKIAVDKNKCKAVFLELLKKREYEKSELYAEIIKEIGADKTRSKDDDNEIKGYVGQLISRYVDEGTVAFKNNKYFIKTRSMKAVPKKPVPESEFKKNFLNRIYENGGSFFENFFANVLEKYYTLTGRTVWDSLVSGGSDDGGIDIKLRISDDLGFVDNVMVQAKCRQNANVTETEVRNFYGAINVVKASRGIFVTTTGFCPTADKLLKSLDNCVGIDGDGVFELSKKTLYGMKISGGGFIFDDRVFDI